MSCKKPSSSRGPIVTFSLMIKHGSWFSTTWVFQGSLETRASYHRADPVHGAFVCRRIVACAGMENCVFVRIHDRRNRCRNPLSRWDCRRQRTRRCITRPVSICFGAVWLIGLSYECTQFVEKIMSQRIFVISQSKCFHRAVRRLTAYTWSTVNGQWSNDQAMHKLSITPEPPLSPD